MKCTRTTARRALLVFRLRPQTLCARLAPPRAHGSSDSLLYGMVGSRAIGRLYPHTVCGLCVGQQPLSVQTPPPPILSVFFLSGQPIRLP